MPEVPVMVTPTVMLAAVLAAFSVSVLVPALLIGLNEAVTPVGSPGGVKTTVAGLKPPDARTAMVLVPLAPGATVKLLGETERLKLGVVDVADVTVRLNAAVCVKLPDVPVSVMGYVPATAVLDAVNVNGDVAVILAGLRVTPLGRPAADSAMAPVKPPDGVTVMVHVPVAPSATVALVAERLKSGVVVVPAPVSVYCAW